MSDSKKKYIEEIIDEYLKENEIIVGEKEKNQIIETLIECNYSAAEKGGIIALRGFMYQYLVAVYYILNIAKGKLDWDYVVYELGDDVALIKDNKICFYQVKTKMDNDEYINFTINGDLTKRTKKLDSWMDKLFLNSKRIKEKMEGLNITLKDDLEVSYRLVINTLYNSMSEIAPYCDNSAELDKDKKILKRLKSIKSFNNQEFNLEDELGESVENYINKFSIIALGGYKTILDKNIALVCEIINDDDTQIAKKIVEELVTMILFNTHDDYLVNEESKKKFIFKKDNFINVVKDKEHNVRTQIEMRRQKRVVSFMFERAFEAIREEFEREFNSILFDELMKTMLWLKDSLLDRVDKDEYIYEKFINRIFLLENNKASCLNTESSIDNSDLVSTLKNIIMYMMFYDNRNIIDDSESKFLVKSGVYNNFKSYLTMYNPRKRKSEIEAVAYIHSKMKKCQVLNSLTGEIICFLLDYKQEYIYEWGLDYEQKITDSGDEFRVISKPENLKFCRISKLEEFMEQVQLRVDRNVILKDHIFSKSPVWNQYLTKSIKE
ncbi:MAG: DUF4297 domain-containing protein [Clostridium beijerinckii]|jgi:hypothetical protein|nr:DUF4297 domain-containing protein [Clostridium beijerinckii]MCI1623580.1 DUF4297 domain-containing protein [Clostridium beijerinckii]